MRDAPFSCRFVVGVGFRFGVSRRQGRSRVGDIIEHQSADVFAHAAEGAAAGIFAGFGVERGIVSGSVRTLDESAYPALVVMRGFEDVAAFVLVFGSFEYFRAEDFSDV